MTDRAQILRRLRGELSLRAFTEFLTANGLPANVISRQRLSRVEQGAGRLTDAEWAAVADALERGGLPAGVLRPEPVDQALAPAPRATPALRHRQWSAIAAGISGSQWWQRPADLIEWVKGRVLAATYRKLAAAHGLDEEEQRRVVVERLARGQGRTFPAADDGVAVVAAESRLSAALDRGDLFILTVTLRNTGNQPWTDRLLFRLGPPVASSLPLTPAVLPVPDTAPGDTCVVLVPGRGQWFMNLAVVSYVLAHPNLAASAPGRLTLRVDTRTQRLDHTLALPPGPAR